MQAAIKKFAITLSTLAFVFVGSVAAQTDSFTLTPWTYDPDNTGTVVAQADGDGMLTLEKNTPTSTNAAAGATIYGVDGMTTDGLTLGFDVEGYCGAGAPRFNVMLTNGDTIFLGCIYGDPENDGTVMFTAGETYGGVLFPEGETIQRIDIVMDEEGQTTLSNIMVNDQIVEITDRTLKIQCKNNGWKNFTTITFKNQGECVSYFMSNRDNAPGQQNNQNTQQQNNSSMGQ